MCKPGHILFPYVCTHIMAIMYRVAGYYASVGGATRHTVVVLSLCLGGRSHEAYCNRVVCHSVSLSVTSFLRRTLKGKL